MAGGSSGKLMRVVRKWRGRAARRGRPLSLALIPAVTRVIVAVIWSAVLLRIQAERQETHDAAVAASVQLASAFAQHIDRTVHDADAAVRWVKYEYERSPSTFDLGTYQRQGLISADTALQVTLVG